MRPLDFEREETIASLGEAAGIFTDSAFRKEKTASRCTTLVRKIALLADSETRKLDEAGGQLPVCKKGCDHCCYRSVKVSGPELIAINAYVNETFDAAAKKALKKRLEAYDKAVAEGDRRPACPLLVKHECSVYEVRPLSCRGVNSFDVQACVDWKEHPELDTTPPQRTEQRLIMKAMGMGLRSATAHHGLSPDLIDLGAGLGRCLADPHAVDRYLEGSDAFETGGAPQATFSRARVAGEPTGFLPADPIISDYLQVLDQAGDTPRAIEIIQHATPTVAKLLGMVVPRVYQSEAEIDEWLQRFDRAFADFEASHFDPIEAFDAMGAHVTFELAYHGRSVKERLSRLGDLVHDRITAKALPDLVQPIDSPRKPGKLRVGYISYALRNNNGGKWALGWLRNHSEEFETYAFNLYQSEDFISARFRDSANHYYHLPDEVPSAARFIKELDLDVLIYTDVGMSGRNTQFASMRLARVQCSAWGHPVTSGLPTIDYYLSSELMEPKDGDSHYREKLVRLPGSGLCYGKVDTPAARKTRADFGLPEGYLPLMCQNIMKCTPKWDVLFKQINERIGGPIAFLGGVTPYETWMTGKRLEDAGIDVVWVPRQTGGDFRRLIELCDVSLDPPAWNGGNTTIEALAVGKPVVTLPTEFMRGRHSLAFLTQANAKGLVAKTPEEYVDLACDPAKQEKAMAKMDAEKLFDDLAPVKALDQFIVEVSG